MLSTPCGSVMLVKASQPENASFPMLFTPCGSVMLVKAVHHENASSQITRVPFRTVYVSNSLFPFSNLSPSLL